MNVVTYTPHGLLPDVRGFAPSLAAQYLARHLLLFRNTHVCGQENHPLSYEDNAELGPIWRLREGRVYRRLFRKMTRLDPWPLHARLARLLKRIPVDLVHAHQLEFPVDDFRRRLGRKIPVVLHAHAVRSFDSSLGMADAYIAVSEFTRDALVQKGFPHERIHVVHNGADVDRFSPATPDDRRHLRTLLGAENKRIVAYVGRKVEQKGYFDFIRTLELLAETRSDIRGIAVGALPPNADRDPDVHVGLARVRNLISRGILLDLPPLPHAGVARVMQLADVLLFTTRFSGEQHPMVLIEALATGCVVITTPVAGIPETVDNGSAILLKEQFTPADIFAATLDVLENPDLYAGMQQRARGRAIDQYDWRRQSVQLERIFFDCLGREAGTLTG